MEFCNEESQSSEFVAGPSSMEAQKAPSIIDGGWKIPPVKQAS
jgi:hypothetical protein